jgi:hypothetical protein
MCSYDLEPAQVWSVTHPACRSEHICCECGLPLRKGERYQRIGCLFEGSLSTYKSHVLCVAMKDFVEKEVCGGHGEIPIGELAEEIGGIGMGPYDASDAANLRAIGFDAEDRRDTEAAFEVLTWVWNLIRDEYRCAGPVTP